jgi:hypothetical protein
MNLEQTQELLRRNLLANPVLGLAVMCSWLDPLLIDEYDSDETEDEFKNALEICRDCFPEVYAATLVALRQNKSDSELNRVIVEGVNRHLVTSIVHIEEMQRGVPFICLGWSFEESDCEHDYQTTDDEEDAWAERLPELVDVADWLGILDEDVFTREDTGRIANLLSKDLDRYPDKTTHKYINWLLKWMFNATDNTLADYTPQGLWDSGLEHPRWTPTQVQSLNEIQIQARQILEFAMYGLGALTTSPAWRTAFQQNVTVIRKKKRGNDARLRLEWPASLEPGDTVAAHHAALLVLFRGSPSPDD